MPKAKKSSRRHRFNYNQDRKKLLKQQKKKLNPRIENWQLRQAWNDKKSTTINLKEMGLAFDPNRSLPIKNQLTPDGAGKSGVVRKPYVIKQLEEEASRPVKDTTSASTDLIEFVQHMIREHGDDYKAMARDEQNYYQDTPKQILRKVQFYQRCHPEHHAAFLASLASK